MLLTILFVFLAGSIVALAFAVYTLIALLRDKVPYVSTSQWAIDWLVSNLKLSAADVVYDLGCGDARVLIALKKKFPDITAVGYERNWWPFVLATIKTRGTGVRVLRKNFYRADLSDATAVFCFLIHSVMPKVEALLRSQLKPGATVYSYSFTFPSWTPIERISNPKRPDGSKINIYRQ